MRKNRQDEVKMSRREVLGGLISLAAATMLPGCESTSEAVESFLQQHFKELGSDDLKKVLARLEKKYQKRFGKSFKVGATPPAEGVTFAYALDISRCVGCRRCVYACVKENNLSRDPQIHWISVLEMDKAHGVDLTHAELYYNPDTVPQDDKFYMPVACQQCENPPCVKVCPVEATWQEKDGIVVVDYDWCLGCRCCMTACPYGARHFNWTDGKIPAEELNTDTEYLGNRPRSRGVVEKCTFCVQRTRKGLYPSCVEICPVGARKFGNMLDPESEIRYVLDHKRVFILKEELNTSPKFFYFFGV